MKRLKFEVNGYVIKELDRHNHQEIEAALKLRYEVFCKKLKWVRSPEKGKEYDRYDEYATFFGVFNASGKMVGFARIVPYNPHGFMFQNEFHELIDSEEIKKIDLKKTIEISRLAVTPTLQGLTLNGNKISKYLFKLIYKWSKIHKKRYWVFCVTEEYLKKLQKLFPIPIHIIGKSKEYQKGVISRLAMIDLKEAEQKVRSQLLKPQFFRLFKFFKR